MPNPLLRIAAAVIAAGIAGTLVNAVAAAALVDGALIRLALEPGRYAVAILVALALPVAFLLPDRRMASGLSLLVLILVPSLIAKLVLGVGAVWATVIGLNAVYAITALPVYVLVAKPLRKTSGPDTELTDGNPSRLS